MESQIDSPQIEIDSIIKNLKEQTTLIRQLESQLYNTQKNVKILKDKLLDICPHKHIICYRYYNSGMHKPEYSRICKSCNQYLSFNQYVKAETIEQH